MAQNIDDIIVIFDFANSQYLVIPLISVGLSLLKNSILFLKRQNILFFCLKILFIIILFWYFEIFLLMSLKYFINWILTYFLIQSKSYPCLR